MRERWGAPNVLNITGGTSGTLGGVGGTSLLDRQDKWNSSPICLSLNDLSGEICRQARRRPGRESWHYVARFGTFSSICPLVHAPCFQRRHPLFVVGNAPSNHHPRWKGADSEVPPGPWSAPTIGQPRQSRALGGAIEILQVGTPPVRSSPNAYEKSTPEHSAAAEKNKFGLLSDVSA